MNVSQSLIQAEIAGSVAFDHSWMNIDPKTTHTFEYHVCEILNRKLMKHDMRCERVKHDMYSDWDIEVMPHDLNTLKDGQVICRIDCERKYKIKFAHGTIPDSWWRGVSFLKRKTDKDGNQDRDIYLLIDNTPISKSPDIIWCTYGNIREFGTHEHRHGEKNEFVVISRKHKNLLGFDFKSVVEYCKKLQNGVIS